MRWLRGRSLAWCLGLAFAAGSVPWVHTLAFGYVFDDRWTLVDNPWLGGRLSPFLALLVRGEAVKQRVPDATRPTMAASMWVDRRVGSPVFSHLESVLLHGALVALAWVVAFALLRSRVKALAVSGLFAVMTAHAEATAVVNYREDLLAALGVLGALALILSEQRKHLIPERSRRADAPAPHLIPEPDAPAPHLIPEPSRRADAPAPHTPERSRRADAPAPHLIPERSRRADAPAPHLTPERSRRADALAALFFLFALGAKESGIALVLLLVPVALWRSGLVHWLRSRERVLVALAAVLAAWGSWRWALTLDGGDGLPRAPSHEAGELVLRCARYFLWTLRSTLLPFIATPMHDAAEPPGVLPLLGLLAVAGAAFAIWRKTRSRSLLLAFAWVFLAALPTSPLAGPANEQADRYLLLPSFGAALAWVIAGGLVPRARTVAWAVLTAAFLVSSVAATLVYRDELTLFRSAVDRSPGSASAWAGLSYVLRHRGELADARAAADNACRLAPDSVSVRLTRAYVLLEQGELERARADLGWVRARGGDAVPGLARATSCSERPSDEIRSCLHQEISSLK